MRLKYLFSIATVCFSFSANAAYTSCAYEAQPCDQFGNHYLCAIVGWTGPNTPQYCSPNDQSTGPGKRASSAVNELEECVLKPSGT